MDVNTTAIGTASVEDSDVVETKVEDNILVTVTVGAGCAIADWELEEVGVAESTIVVMVVAEKYSHKRKMLQKVRYLASVRTRKLETSSGEVAHYSSRNS